MTHKLPELPWKQDALVPYMSVETIEFHYGKHHKGYVEKLNKLVQGGEFSEASLEEIIARASGPVFNNGAQVWNHTFFWNSLSPRKQQPAGPLLEAITREFGSVARFQEKFAEAATGHFGSGWAWLSMDQGGKLVVETTPNADNPIRKGHVPLLVCDAWEHAYYIDYRNDRARFIASFWNICNWDFVARNFEAAKTKSA